VLAATDLAGLNRGEVLRLWIFLACFFQIPVAYACATTRTPYAIMIAVTSTLLLTCVGAATMRFVIP
jgi:methylthioxylose transferase